MFNFFVEGDLQFDAAHDDVSAIIRELEERVEIEQISRLTIRRGSSRASDRVTVQLLVQAWVMTKDTGRGGGS